MIMVWAQIYIPHTIFMSNIYYNIIDSERSDECIDSTMMFFYTCMIEQMKIKT